MYTPPPHGLSYTLLPDGSLPSMALSVCQTDRIAPAGMQPSKWTSAASLHSGVTVGAGVPGIFAGVGVTTTSVGVGVSVVMGVGVFVAVGVMIGLGVSVGVAVGVSVGAGVSDGVGVFRASHM